MADTSAKPKVRDKISKWDSKDECSAPLKDVQLESIMDLTNLTQSRPFPDGLMPDDRNASASYERDCDLLPLTTYSLSSAAGVPRTHLPLERLENAQQFYSWFNSITESIEEDDDISYIQYMSQLSEYKSKCSLVLSEVSHALEYLKELKQKYVVVSTKTNTLHEACEQLLEEQTRLMNVAEAIQTKLTYFNDLDRMSVKLESPTLAVTSESFVPMLLRLDECIAFIASNPQYQDSELFLQRFRQCQSRALGLIKAHVVSILQQATAQVQPRKDAASANEDAFTLYYGKFRTNAPKVKSLMEQIEQRTITDKSYEQILADCHQCYFAQRMMLVGPTVSAALSELAAKHTRDHCALMRSGCALTLHVCEDEHQLFFSFFTKPTAALNTMLQGMCSHLYDIFRPLIVHVNHLETLSELCSILKVEMLDESVPPGAGGSAVNERLQAFEAVCRQMLADVQERLVYRTYVYIGTDILRYQPAPGDLAYPQKLEMMESIAQSIKKVAAPTVTTSPRGAEYERSESAASLESLEVAAITSSALLTMMDGSSPLNRADSINQNGSGLTLSPSSFTMRPASTASVSSMPSSPADMHGMWYPTVRRTLVCLSKLARCTDRTTFQGLSQETLTYCIQSLLAARAAIEARASTLDGLLFYIKHLLILREQIAPFQVEFAVKESAFDFSKMKDAAFGLMQRKGDVFKFNSSNALLRFFFEGTPQVTEHIVDSKREVDSQLKTSCEAFIDHVIQMLTAPLKSFIFKVEAVEKLSSSAPGTSEDRQQRQRQHVQLRSQPFSKPEAVRDALADAYRLLKARVPGVQHSMSLYLANRDTEQILLKPIKQEVINDTQRVTNILEKYYSEEERQIVSCPAVEQVSLMMAPKFH